MINLIVNPDTAPEIFLYLDDFKVSSIENKQLYGYYCVCPGDCGILNVEEPGYYMPLVWGESYQKINIVLGEDCTTEFFNIIGETPAPGEYVKRCNITISGTTFVYFLSRNELENYGHYTFLFTANIEEMELFVAKDGEEVYIGTYNLENGQSVEIVRVCDNTSYDTNNNSHTLKKIQEYKYFKVEGHPDLYYTTYTYDPNIQSNWCEKLPNGHYKTIGSSIDFEFPNEHGMCTHLFFHSDYSERNYITTYTGYTEGESTVVTDSAGTPTAITNYVKCIFINSGSEIYAVYLSMGYNHYYFFTGTTWNNLVWSGDYGDVRTMWYDIYTYPARSDEYILTADEPTVAYVESSQTLYYAAYSVPIRHENDFIYMTNGRYLHCDGAFHNEIEYYVDLQCGNIYVYGDYVDKVEVFTTNEGWVDITEGLKDGTYSWINLWNNIYYEPALGWRGEHYCEESNIVFTEEFTKTGILFAEGKGCLY